MMTNRRRFLKAATGLVFCGCSPFAYAQALAPGRAPPSLMVDGTRVRTIDVHAHCYFQDAIALMGAEAGGVLPPVKGVPEHFIVVDERLRAMDAQGVDMQVLSINPFWYRKDRETATAIVELHNRKLGELCGQRPDRLAAFGSLALQFPDVAVKQLDDAMRRHGLKGAAVGASVAGDELSDPKFHPVWAKAEELGAVVFVHPQSTPELAKRFKGNGWLSNTIGNPLDTTIALSHLIFEGVLDRFPKLKVLAAHGGGYLGSYAPRSDHACFVSPVNCDPSVKLAKAPSEYLNQLWFDSLLFTGEGLRHLVAQVGARQVVVGSDHPIPWSTDPVRHVLETSALSDEDKAAILGANAERLLGLRG